MMHTQQVSPHLISVSPPCSPIWVMVAHVTVAMVTAAHSTSPTSLSTSLTSLLVPVRQVLEPYHLNLTSVNAASAVHAAQVEATSNSLAINDLHWASQASPPHLPNSSTPLPSIWLKRRHGRVSGCVAKTSLLPSTKSTARPKGK